MIAIPKQHLWLARFPSLLGAGVCIAGLGFTTSIIMDPAVADGGLALSLLTFVIAGFALIIMSLRVNRMGIYAEGFAPPIKPLKHLLSEPWILPWKDLTEVETVHPPKWAALPDGKGLRIVSSPLKTEWRLAVDRVPKWFGDPLEAKRFFAVLNRIGERIRELGRPLASQEAGDIIREVVAGGR